MSTIERVAELGGSFSKPFPKPSAPGRGSVALEPDVIERAVGGKSARPDPANDREPVARFDAEAKAGNSRGRVPRILKIDQDKLRQQSIITPAGDRTPIGESFRRVKRQILANVANPGPVRRPTS